LVHVNKLDVRSMGRGEVDDGDSVAAVLGPAERLRGAGVDDDVPADSAAMQMSRETERETGVANRLGGEGAVRRPGIRAAGAVQQEDVTASVVRHSEVIENVGGEWHPARPRRPPHAQVADPPFGELRASWKEVDSVAEGRALVWSAWRDRVVVTSHQDHLRSRAREPVRNPAESVRGDVLVLPEVPTQRDDVNGAIRCQRQAPVEGVAQLATARPGVLDAHSHEGTVEVDIGDVRDPHRIGCRHPGREPDSRGWPPNDGPAPADSHGGGSGVRREGAHGRVS
jgi:hypothetical protein